MSMISEQVKRLRKLANQWKHNDVAGCNLIFEAADTIEALSAKARASDKPTGWIPVTEKPKENGEYIASLEDSVYPWAKFFNGKWFMLSLNGTAREFGEYEVIAWMPLPEPYKGGDAE